MLTFITALQGINVAEKEPEQAGDNYNITMPDFIITTRNTPILVIIDCLVLMHLLLLEKLEMRRKICNSKTMFKLHSHRPLVGLTRNGNWAAMWNRESPQPCSLHLLMGNREPSAEILTRTNVIITY
jgi:hypothetical protein